MLPLPWDGTLLQRMPTEKCGGWGNKFQYWWQQQQWFLVCVLQMCDVAFHQIRKGGLNKNHVYLDMCSTFHQLVNKDLVEDIQEAQTGLVGHCNAGTTITTTKGNLDYWKSAWMTKELQTFCHLTSLNNIFSLSTPQKGMCISSVTNLGSHILMFQPPKNRHR